MRSLVAGVSLRVDRTRNPPFLLELWLDSTSLSRVRRFVGNPRLTPTVVIYSTVEGPGLKSIQSEGSRRPRRTGLKRSLSDSQITRWRGQAPNRSSRKILDVGLSTMSSAQAGLIEGRENGTSPNADHGFHRLFKYLMVA